MNRLQHAVVFFAYVLACGHAGADDEPRITFHDVLSGGEQISLVESSFSVPSPTLVIDPVVRGTVEDHPGKTVLEYNGGAEYRIRVTGVVYDFIADAVADNLADIDAVEIRSHAGGLSDLVRLDAPDASDIDSIRPHLMSEQLAQRPGVARAIRPYPFVGRFESGIYTLPVTTGSNPVYVVATNINGGEAVAVLDINAKVDREAQRYRLTAETRSDTDVGLYNPVLVYIEDPTVTPENVGRARARMNGTEVGLRFIDSQLQLDRPIMGLSRINHNDIPNLVNVTGQPDHFVIRYGDSQAAFHWSYTAASVSER